MLLMSVYLGICILRVVFGFQGPVLYTCSQKLCFKCFVCSGIQYNRGMNFDSIQTISILIAVFSCKANGFLWSSSMHLQIKYTEVCWPAAELIKPSWFRNALYLNNFWMTELRSCIIFMCLLPGSDYRI
jgi:hypothetical protein